MAPQIGLTNTLASKAPEQRILALRRMLDALGYSGAQPVTTPDPYAPSVLNLPGAGPIPLPSQAAIASILEQQAARLKPDPYAASAVERQAELDALNAELESLRGATPPEQQYTPIDLSGFARPTLQTPSAPERPRAVPSAMMLGASALAGLLTGRMPEALQTVQQVAEAQAARQHSDNMSRWRTALDEAQRQYEADREARAEAVQSYTVNAAGRDRAANANRTADWDRRMRLGEIGAKAASAGGALKALGSLSTRAQDYQAINAQAEAARRDVERSDALRKQEVSEGRGEDRERRMAMQSLLQSDAAYGRVGVAQQNADTSAKRAQDALTLGQARLAAQQRVASIRAGRPRGGGSRTEEQRYWAGVVADISRELRDARSKYNTARNQAAARFIPMAKSETDHYDAVISTLEKALNDARQSYHGVAKRSAQSMADQAQPGPIQGRTKSGLQYKIQVK